MCVCVCVCVCGEGGGGGAYNFFFLTADILIPKFMKPVRKTVCRLS